MFSLVNEGPNSLLGISHMFCVAYTPQCFLTSFAPGQENQ